MASRDALIILKRREKMKQDINLLFRTIASAKAKAEHLKNEKDKSIATDLLGKAIMLGKPIELVCYAKLENDIHAYTTKETIEEARAILQINQIYKDNSDYKQVLSKQDVLITPACLKQIQESSRDQIIYNPIRDEIIIPAQTITNKDGLTSVSTSLSLLFENLSKKYGNSKKA